MPNSASLFAAIVAGSALLLAPALRATDANPPYVAKSLPALVVPVGTGTSKVSVKKTFGLTGVSQQVVRFSTTLGNIDVELRPDVAPATVANFLTYVNSGAYTNSFLHRLVQNFVLQGGGYTYGNNTVQTIPTNAPVANEFKLTNARGTLAMAQAGTDKNSATDEWFFNLVDNNNPSGNDLDTLNGGFAVFGDVIEDGMDVVDAIAALSVVNAGSPFDTLPVRNYTSGSVTADNLIFVNTITSMKMVPSYDGEPALLSLSAKSSNPGLVTPQMVGNKLLLTYSPGATGNAVIAIKAKNSAKSKIKATFAVTVQ